MTRICVGVVNKSFAWENFFFQNGIFFEKVNFEDLNYSAIIVNDVLDDIKKEQIKTYLKNGGSVLTSTKFLKNIFYFKTQKKYVKSILPSNDKIFKTNFLIDINSVCEIVEGANFLIDKHKNHTTLVTEKFGGNLISFPFELDEIIFSQKTETKNFFSNTKRFSYEKVSSVSKNEVRKLVFNAIEFLHHKRKLPFIHLNNFPNRKKNNFLFRIDTDKANKFEIEKLYKTIEKYGIKATWFLDVKIQSNNFESYKKFKNQEIATHCYYHNSFETEKKFFENISLAKNILQQNNFLSNGFASPYGEWNFKMQNEIEKFNFNYSSEFSFDYDNLPSFPKNAKTLQIPIHPICIGSLKNANMTEPEMKNYFYSEIQKKIFCNEPLVFYHHPKDGNENILEFIFEQVKDFQNLTFDEFTSFWKKRDQFLKQENSIEIENEKINIQNFSDEFQFRITNENGENIIEKNNCSLSELNFEKKHFQFDKQKLFRTINFSPRLIKIKVQTFFRKKF